MKNIFIIEPETNTIQHELRSNDGSEEVYNQDSLSKINSTVKFHINSKEPKSVEILLQQMFQLELENSNRDYN